MLDPAEEEAPPLSVDGRALASRKNDCGVQETKERQQNVGLRRGFLFLGGVLDY